MAPLIEWRDEFKTGIASVDYEHRNMIVTINDLHGDTAIHRDKPAVESVLGEIHAGISAHFALEEKVMREMGYPAYAAHKSEHEALLDEISAVLAQVRNDPDFDYQDSLRETLRHWFGDHFKNADAKLHRMTG